MVNRVSYTAGLILLSLTLNGCSNLLEGFKSLAQSQSPLTLSGTAVMFASVTSAEISSASVCSTATAELFRLDDNDNISTESLLSTKIAPDGSFSFAIDTADFDLNTNLVRYMILVRGCGEEYRRPVTGFISQNITYASTLVSLSTKVESNTKRLLSAQSRDQIANIIEKLRPSEGIDLSTTLANLIATPNLKETFENSILLNPAALNSIPPREWTLNGPLNLDEGTTYSYSLTLIKWIEGHNRAYRWKIDGQIASDNSVFIYTPSANSQGMHILQVEIGVDQGDGTIDATQNIVTKTYMLTVNNTILPSAPPLTRTSPSTTNSRVVNMKIAAGANCASVSALALTENSTNTPDANAFTIPCSSNEIQNLSYQISSSGGGTKTLRLWARDNSGLISTTASTVQLILDTSPPIINHDPISAAISSTSLTVNFSASDETTSVSSVSCKLDSQATATCSSPFTMTSLSEGTHSLIIVASDNAGNITNTYLSWTVDLTNPTVTIATPVSDDEVVPYEKLPAFTASGTCSENGRPVTLGGSFSTTTTCLNGVWSKSLDLSNLGTEMLTLVAGQSDVAGNSSSVTRTFWAAPNCPATTTVNKWGVNMLWRSGSALLPNLEDQFKILRARNLRSIRVDIPMASDTDPYMVTLTRKMVNLARKQCINVNPILWTPFAWGDRTDNGRYPLGDSSALYNQAYNRTLAFVSTFKNDIKDWELANEVNLLNIQKNLNGQHPFYGEGFNASEWDTSTYNDWKFILKGMSDAIEDVNVANNLGMRRVLNTTSTHFGFIKFMKNFGVKVDVISYHYYENQGTNPHNYWGTFDLFAKLAEFGVPVKINEFNCAEIYNSSFVNSAGTTLYERCLTNLRTQLNYFVSQNSVRIEEIDLYQFLDDPKKTGAESRFGLMFDISNPKTLLHLVTAFAAGTLTPAEQTELTSRGLFPL